jgi:hypothetical protein
MGQSLLAVSVEAIPPVSEQRTLQRLETEVRALEYELTAARVWLAYQADHIARLEAALVRASAKPRWPS